VAGDVGGGPGDEFLGAGFAILCVSTIDGGRQGVSRTMRIASRQCAMSPLRGLGRIVHSHPWVDTHG